MVSCICFWSIIYYHLLSQPYLVRHLLPLNFSTPFGPSLTAILESNLFNLVISQDCDDDNNDGNDNKNGTEQDVDLNIEGNDSSPANVDIGNKRMGTSN